MKKFALVSLFALSFLLIGCGQNTTTPTDEDAGTEENAPTANSAQVDAAVAPTEAPAPEVDLEKTTKLADCLTEKKMTMYGTERCGHCKNQKQLFGDAFAKVTYVDCDAQRQTCLDAGVRGFPTWIDGQGNQYPGTQQLEKLAEVAGCEM